MVGHKSRGRKRRVKTRQIRSRFKLWATLAITGTILFFIIFNDHGLYRLNQQRRERAKLLAEIDQLKQQEAHLMKEKQSLESDLEYIEKLARDRYRMVKAGEKVFRVVEGQTPAQ